MTVWEALSVVTPPMLACYVIGLIHGSGFLTMKDSSGGRGHSSVRHIAKAFGRASESRDGMVSSATNDPSEKTA